LRGEAKSSERSVKIGIICIFISSCCLCISIAWILTNAFSYIYMIPVWIIGVSSFLIMLIQRQITYYKDVKNIEDVNDPRRGINDE